MRIEIPPGTARGENHAAIQALARPGYKAEDFQMASEGDSIDPDKRYGWWSEAHRPYVHRLLVYKDQEGNEITLTGVTSTKNRIGYRWGDAQLKGELTTLVRVETLKPIAPTKGIGKVRASGHNT